jgi:hypothetical protein
MSKYKIYPSIGVARVGNAPKKFTVGPEVYRGLPTNPDGTPFSEQDLRDDEGRMCRQAAQFRIFRQGPNGPEEVTLETSGVKSITWTAHLANKKSSWYEFVTNEGQSGYASNHKWRNASVKDRHKLVIDAGPRSIAGRKASPVCFDKDSVPVGYKGAHFPKGSLAPTGQSIDTLGELHTDGEGRLLVLGGLGISGTTDKTATIVNYANNDNWWDDTSDGPVSAVIELTNGTSVDVEAAWVMVGPPSYAPQIPNLVTLWDTIFDTAVRSGHFPAIFEREMWKSGEHGYRPNFATEIRPLLERATLYPWVTAIPPKPHTFDMAMLGALEGGRGSDAYKGLRDWVFSFVRPPSHENEILNKGGATMMPYLAGDNCLKTETLTSNYLRLTDTQYFFLQQWAEGWFVNEEGNSDAATAITRGVLENCVGGAFSPGIEMTWISRNSAIYHSDDPFRINAVQVPNGPLSLGFDPKRMEPGDICRYMAVPWQADFNECSSQPIDGRVIWWWPAQRPEFVYLEPVPKTASADAVTPPPDQQTGAQVAWVGTDFDQLRDNFISFADDVQMVELWAGLGFILEKKIGGIDKFVEVQRTLPRPIPAASK